MSNSYCVKCGDKTPNVSEYLSTTINGRNVLKSQCKNCGCKKNEFVSSGGPKAKKPAKEGKGFLDFLI